MYYSPHDLPKVPAEQKKVISQNYISAEPHQTHSLPQLRTAQKHPINKTPDPWRPGDQRVFCYFCGFETQPTLRRQKRCTSKPSLIALVVQKQHLLYFVQRKSEVKLRLLLNLWPRRMYHTRPCKRIAALLPAMGNDFNSPRFINTVIDCWPLCFTPYLTTTSQVIDLYCRRCDHYLGSYDRTLGYLTKDYVVTNIGIRSCHNISAI